jgi:hypothetical protein
VLVAVPQMENGFALKDKPFPDLEPEDPKIRLRTKKKQPAG